MTIRAKILRKLQINELSRKFVCFFRRLKKRLKWKYKVLISEDYKAIYFPIMKVASVSLRKAFEKMGFEEKELNKIKNLSDYYKFVFTRDDLDRLKSCWKDKIKKPSEMGVLANAPGLLYEDMPFEKFLESIRKIPKNRQDKHFRNQNWFISDNEGNFLVDEVINLKKMSDLENKYIYICKKIGIKNPYKLGHLNKSR